ncbi:MAG: exonuclease domain-containing protein [Anaerolineae bacterium]|nr:exonuclease domain-containing protein [Anaerolineae bacterium]
MPPDWFDTDKILVIDVESTCWKGQPPAGEQSEIIEIGLCWLNVMTKQPEGKRSVLVRPSRSKVSPFCTRLTTLTQADVNQGIHFWEACLMLQEEYQIVATMMPGTLPVSWAHCSKFSAESSGNRESN